MRIRKGNNHKCVQESCNENVHYITPSNDCNPPAKCLFTPLVTMILERKCNPIWVKFVHFQQHNGTQVEKKFPSTEEKETL